jgi:hypothetical protein
MKKTYNLSIEDIENLKNDLLNYKNNVLNKLPQFVKELTDAGLPVIEARMAQATVKYDEKGIKSGADTSHNKYVTLSYTDTSAKATLVVEGEELLFIEFGAGVHYNKNLGSSPHDKGKEFGFLIGSYGKGYGARQAWGYYDESGNLIITRGVKATMPVYSVVDKTQKTYIEIARKVFGNVDK